METIINGLLVQKANSRAPEPNEERYFSWEQRQGKSGKSYIKIKNDSQEYGGTLCRIVDAERTDFTDAHGNVSFNVGFTPQKNGGEPPVDEKSRELAESLRAGDYTTSKAYEGINEARKHIMQAVNLYNLCVDAVDVCVKPHINNCSAELYQAAVGTLFIEASRAGFVSKMPTGKLK